MTTRIITSAVALAVLAAVLISPPIVFNIAICAVIFVMLYECAAAAKMPKSVTAAGFVSAAAVMAAIYESIYCHEPLWENSFVGAAVIFTLLVHLGVTIFEHGKTNYASVLSSGMLTLYITLSMSCIALARDEYGTAIMIIIFICAWTTDTGAYFVGKFFGRRKLIPHVSPNKTIAGAVGGVATSAVCCTAYLLIYLKAAGTPLSAMWIIPICAGLVIGAVSGALAQLGDLAASAIKRDTGVKDFGWIFPGHGGFMDRFDSVLYIAPVIYFMLYLWIS